MFDKKTYLHNVKVIKIVLILIIVKLIN